jgi:hypothetical protein
MLHPIDDRASSGQEIHEKDLQKVVGGLNTDQKVELGVGAGAVAAVGGALLFKKYPVQVGRTMDVHLGPNDVLHAQNSVRTERRHLWEL